MAAPQRPQLRLAADCAAQAVSPCARRVEDAAGLHLEGLAIRHVVNLHAVDATLSERQGFHRHPIADDRAAPASLGEHAHDEPGIVGLGVEIRPSPFQA